MSSYAALLALRILQWLFVLSLVSGKGEDEGIAASDGISRLLKEDSFSSRHLDFIHADTLQAVPTTTTVEVLDLNFQMPSMDDGRPAMTVEVQERTNSEDHSDVDHVKSQLDESSSSDCTDSDDACVPGGERRLAVPLPNVTSVDFQDMDLSAGKIGGTVSWVFSPPSIPLGITGYKVYLTTSTGNVLDRVFLGSVGSVSTKTLSITNVTMQSYTHIFVHLATALGESPAGTGFAFCDVDHTDAIHIVNHAATTAPWGITEISFYVDPMCGGSPIRFASTSAVTSSASHPSSYGADGLDSTAWISNCSVVGTCAQGTQSWGMLGVCQADSVRCVKMKQCVPGSTQGGCTTVAGRTPALAILIKGILVQIWYSMMPSNPPSQLQYFEEQLVFQTRRRRGFYGVYSDLDSDIKRTTNPGFTR
jgi:hypothetical protein